MTTAPTMTPRDLARARWQEAERVKDAYDAQVIRRRHKWRASVPGKEADRARRMLQDAIVEQTAAGKIERAAWKLWHSLERAGT